MFLSEEPIVPRPLLESIRPLPPGAPTPQLPEDFPKIPTDPAQCPGKGWQWRGPDAPGGPRGGWYNPGRTGLFIQMWIARRPLNRIGTGS